MAYAKYEVGKQWFFPELGRKPDVGEVVDLPVEAAERYMHNEPGLLKPVLRTTQAKPEVVRSEKPKTAKPKMKHRARR